MSRAFLSAVGAVALTIAGAATAQVTTGPTTLDTVGTPTSADGGVTTTFGYEDSHLTSPTFTETLQINNLDPGVYSILLGTSSANVDFSAFVPGSCTGVVCTGTYLTDLTGSAVYPLLMGFNVGANEGWLLPETMLAAGSYILNISGSNSNTGSLGGSVTIVAGAVPEPGTWALMLLGFAGMGMAVRKRRRNSGALMQVA